MKRILSIVGARPQFIKAAVISRVIRKRNDAEEIIIHTGQHFDDNMSQLFFKEMEIPEARYNLGINSKSETEMTGQMIIGIGKILSEEKPDIVLVYGDTTTTLAGAIAAQKMGIKTVHIEAGLRSFNRSMPEEINRILTDRTSDLLFCPTHTAIDNLMKEGFDGTKQRVILSGDVMMDAFLYYKEIALNKKSFILEKVRSESGFILCTLHRQANVDNRDRLKSIFNALDLLTEHIQVVMPCHPRTRKNLLSAKIKTKVHLIDPIGYFDMINLLTQCQLVLTDSGGLQKEAYFAEKFCITLREETEWIELVEHGYNFLTGSEFEKIISIYEKLKSASWRSDQQLYGTGRAGEMIVENLFL